MNEKQTQSVIEKIHKLDFNFTDDEKTIIEQDGNLSYLLLKTLINNPSLIDSLTNVQLDQNAYQLLNEEEKISLLILEFNYFINAASDFSLGSFYQAGEMISIQNIELLIEKIAESKLSDLSFNFGDTRYEKTIDFLALKYMLDYKRYDLIEQCVRIKDENDSDFANQIIERFFKEYPFDKYKRPRFIYDVVELIDSDRLTLGELIEKYNMISNNSPWAPPLTNVDDDGIKLEFQRLIDRIHKTDDLSSLDDDIMWYRVLNSMSTDEIHSFLQELMNKGYYIDEMFDGYYAIETNIMDLKENLHNDIMNNKKIHTALLEYLLKNGYEISDEETNVIIRNINEKNPLYDEFLQYVNYDLASLPIPVVKAIIDSGKLKRVKAFSYNKNKNYYELFLSLINKCPYMDYSYINIENANYEIIEALIKNKIYYMVVGILSKPEIVIESNIMDLLKLTIKKDNYFAEMLLRASNLLDYDELTNIYFENDNLFFLLMNGIIHNDDNEKYTRFYSDDNYHKAKHFFVNKYKLNIDHMDELENILGPTILKYLTSENIQEIINLDDDSFHKIINLFEEKRYTMVDLEATYEALIQHAFSMEKPDVIDLFTYYKNALQDNDLAKISEYNDKLMLRIYSGLAVKIAGKFNIVINSTEELLSIIIDTYQIPEKRQEALNILKEITDRYKLLEYKDYRNNYYLYQSHKELNQMFDTIINLIDDNQYFELKKYKDMIVKVVDDDLLQLLRKSPYSNFAYYYSERYSEIIDKILYNIECGINKEQNMELLRIIVDYYIDKVRKETLKHSSIGDDLGLPYSLDEKSADKSFIDYLVMEMDSLYISRDSYVTLTDLIFEQLQEKGLNITLIHDLYEYYYNKNVKLSNPIDVVQKNMKLFVVTAYKLAQSTILYNYSDGNVRDQKDYIIKMADNERKVKRNYYLDKSSVDIFRILSEINVKYFVKRLLKDEKKYEILKKIMDRRKIHLLPDSIIKMFSRDNIKLEFSEAYVAAFINYFDYIYDAVSKTLLSSKGSFTDEDLILGVVSILKYSMVFGDMSSVYSLILGEEDGKLIKLNPKENTNQMPEKQRLKKAVELTPLLFKRNSVTIPTFSETITFDNGTDSKQIDAIVGNFTDPCNLTHGERTGACMRIGGAGDELLYFCLQNENGFHIRFEDPKTHEYISRVSGFRNGNTVFLNELRCSKNPELYSDYDLECALEEVSKKIIGMSKSSNYPIDNVVVHREYATKNSPKKEVNLGILNVREGFSYFWTDVSNYAILLASSAQEGYVPVSFDKTNLPHYPVVRSRIIVSDTLYDVSNKINRVSAVKKLLNDEEYEYIEPITFENGLIYAAVADDWYVYVDEKMEVHSEVIDIDSRALEEMQTYLEHANKLSQGKDMSL